MARPTSRKRSPVSEAIIRLRQVLAESQQQFAARTGLAITTVARYETSRPPRGIELGQFSRLAAVEAARANEAADKARADIFNDCAKTFVQAMVEDLGLEAKRIPVDIEEGFAVEALLTVMRNRHIPGVAETYRAARRELSKGLDHVEHKRYS